MNSAVLSGRKTHSTQMLQPAEPRETKWHGYAVGLMTATVVFCAMVWAFFVPPHLDIDDIGLFNPVYMYVHYGKITYPTYGSFQEMVVHPPTHYVVLAWLAKLGVPPSYIAALPPFLLIVLAASLIWLSKFPSTVKLGLLFGLLAGSLFPCYLFILPTAFSFGFRPDLHLAFAWFAGLIALETGRLDDWNFKRLFLGSALLTYASALHYPAFVAWTGVFTYVVWVLRLRGWRKASKPILALIAGGCLVGFFYLALFVVPHWHSSLAFVRSAEPFGGVGVSVKAHLNSYRFLYYSFALQPFSRVLFYPLTLGIPAVLISTLTFVLIPSTRGIALASLPHLLMLLLLVQRKSFGYFIPEFMLYVCALAVCVVCGLDLIARKIGVDAERIFAFTSSTVLAGLLLFGIRWLSVAQFTLRPRVLEFDVARAAGRQMLGAQALVGARLARFYTNGGDLSYMLEPDLLWRKIGNLNVASYFGQFDGIAEDSFSSSLTVNEERQSLASWYARGPLNLRGFYFSSLYPGLSYLLLNVNGPPLFQAYGLLPSGQVAHFRRDPNGAFTFVAATCGVGALNKLAIDSIFRNAYLLPASTPLGAPEMELETFVEGTAAYEQLRPKLATQCSFRDEIRMSEDQIDRYRFIDTLKSDRVIHFYKHLEDALDARYGPELQVEPGGDGWPNKVIFQRGVHQGESYPLQFSGANMRELFRSDMDSLAPWAIQRFTKAGGMEIVHDGLRDEDRCGRYSSNTAQDSLTSPFAQSSVRHSGLFFFSAWAKPLRGASLPSIFLQDQKYESVAYARPVIHRSDGWVLMAGWAEPSKADQVRLVIQQESGAISLFDKAYIAEIASSTDKRIPLSGNGN